MYIVRFFFEHVCQKLYWQYLVSESFIHVSPVYLRLGLTLKHVVTWFVLFGLAGFKAYQQAFGDYKWIPILFTITFLTLFMMTTEYALLDKNKEQLMDN